MRPKEIKFGKIVYNQVNRFHWAHRKLVHLSVVKNKACMGLTRMCRAVLSMQNKANLFNSPFFICFPFSVPINRGKKKIKNKKLWTHKTHGIRTSCMHAPYYAHLLCILQIRCCFRHGHELKYTSNKMRIYNIQLTSIYDRFCSDMQNNIFTPFVQTHTNTRTRPSTLLIMTTYFFNAHRRYTHICFPNIFIIIIILSLSYPDKIFCARKKHTHAHTNYNVSMRVQWVRMRCVYVFVLSICRLFHSHIHIHIYRLERRSTEYFSAAIHTHYDCDGSTVRG